ncbi:MAG TPA: protein kinase [Candidatus Krumholzibacteria bacterium]|nr:protein kinase [Candidatus Krumholzibacteria bacterium]
MNLTPGTRLGPYEILSPLGAGGMGEVYRARDTRLGREVAIKSLPADFAQDAERLARFEREARLLATLNHPNIAGIHGLEDVGGTRYLVLEFVDGETLAARIARGAMPLDETLEIAGQIASGVEAAHESGVIHRDLKPGNVIITPSGQAKVLDFGLATSSGATAPGSNPNLSHSPTVTNQATRAGVILGTAAYMSPEQARGKVVDRRTDIWSFGCIVYECLTGRQLYQGETVSDLIARILEREPDWSALPANTPARLRELLKRCLQKDPRERLRDMGDARLELETIAKGGSAAAVATGASAGPGVGRRRMWFVVVAVAIATAIVTSLLTHGGNAPAPGFEFTLVPPDGYTFALPANPAVSPDGKTVVCSLQDSTANTFLAVRRLDRDEFRVLPGTSGASYPFWSPDGQNIAFYAPGKLMRVALDGSTPVALADAPDGRCGSWSKDGTIVFAPTSSGPCFKVSASGGKPVQVTTLDAGRGEVGQRYPVFLRDQEHFLYIAMCRDGKKWLCVGDVNGGASRALKTVETCSVPTTPGWLATVENHRVLVQQFDEDSFKFEDDPREIAQCGSWDKIGDPNLAADAHGTIVYQRELVQPGWLRWYDVTTHSLGPRIRMLDTPIEAALAPDQRHLAVTMGADHDLWLVDLEQPVPTRLTFFKVPQLGGLYQISWSNDSKRIAYALEATKTNDVIHVYSTATSSDTTLFPAPGMFATPAGWTPDGTIMAALCSDSTGNFDPWVIPVAGTGKPAPLARTPEFESTASLSPDGRWLALTVAGNSTSITIRSFPRNGSRFEPTIGGELTSYFNPIWSADSRAVIAQDVRGRVIEVPVSFEGGFRQGTPKVLFTLAHGQRLVTRVYDGRRLMILENEQVPNPAPLRVLTQWPRRLTAH